MEAVVHLRLPTPPRSASISLVSDDTAPSDAALLERVATRDHDAFVELYRRYARAVFGLALRRLGDRGRAEDATQEAFASIWRSAARYDRARGPGAPWLYTVARNAIVDGLRRTPEPAAETPDIPSAEPGPARQAEAAWAAWRVHRALETLPPTRARGDRARVLERPLAERGGRVPRHPARHREDADAQRARPPRRRARGGSSVSGDAATFRRAGRRRRARRSASASSACTSSSSRPGRRRSCHHSSPSRRTSHACDGDPLPAPLPLGRARCRGDAGAWRSSASGTRSAAASAPDESFTVHDDRAGQRRGGARRVRCR